MPPIPVIRLANQTVIATAGHMKIDAARANEAHVRKLLSLRAPKIVPARLSSSSGFFVILGKMRPRVLLASIPGAFDARRTRAAPSKTFKGTSAAVA